MASDNPHWIRWSAQDHVEEADRLVNKFHTDLANGGPVVFVITPLELTQAQIHATLAVAKSSKYYHQLCSVAP